MLDDLLDLAADLVGDTAAEFMSDSTRKRRGNAAAKYASRERGRPAQPARKAAPKPSHQNRTVGKTTARREKRGEDPWDWKEERPPWEG